MITDPYARADVEDEIYDAARRLRDHPPRRARREHTGRPHADADLVEIGCFLVEGDPRKPMEAEENLYLNDEGVVRSGTVYAVVNDVDQETGEITRAFLVVKQHKGRLVWDRFASSRVGMIGPPESSRMRYLARACAREIGERKKRGPFTTDDLRALDALDALVRSLS